LAKPFAVDKNIEKLSSGMRINRAGDDASGLAVSEKMRSQIRGLQRAEKNAADGISLIQTTEGYLQETQDILQFSKETDEVVEQTRTIVLLSSQNQGLKSGHNHRDKSSHL